MRTPLNPKHPERVCWGCARYCPAEDLACGNGTIRAPHPAELFGNDWFEPLVFSGGDASGGTNQGAGDTPDAPAGYAGREDRSGAAPQV